MEQSGAKPSDALLTHCNREFFHAQWRILLDDEFLEAYEHGIVMTFQDEVKCRIYPRIFTYCQVQVKGRESGSRIRVRFVYDESSRRGRVGLGQTEGKSIRFNDRGGKC